MHFIIKIKYIRLAGSLAFLAFIAPPVARAQQPGDSSVKVTSVNLVADKANEGMPAGMDIRIMAKAATIHHYPLPDDILGYQKQLGLTAEQVTRLNVIVKTLNLKKLEISQSVALNEKTLDKIFASRKPDDGTLIFYGNRYGLYEGEMRTAVLTACAQTAQVLTPRQNTKFEQIKKP